MCVNSQGLILFLWRYSGSIGRIPIAVAFLDQLQFDFSAFLSIARCDKVHVPRGPNRGLGWLGYFTKLTMAM